MLDDFIITLHRPIEAVAMAVDEVIHQKPSGELSYLQYPLYLTNAGVMLTICQLCNSVISLAFIWCQIKVAGSFDSYRLVQILALLGMMHIFEYLGYCSLTHCFFVTGYYGRKTHGDRAERLPRWLTPPRCEGSVAWQRLQLPSQPLDDLMNITNQLSQHVVQMKDVGTEAQVRLDYVLRSFQIFSCTVGLFLCACCQLFVYSFWKLLKRNRLEAKIPKPKILGVGASLKNSSSSDDNSPQVSSENRHDSKTPLSTRQFLYLTMRAVSILLSMVMAIVLLLVFAIRPAQVLMDPYWRGFMAWLSTAGNTFSAICIAWQSWRLYIDQSTSSTSSGSQGMLISMSDLDSQSRWPKAAPSETRSSILEIKLCPDGNPHVVSSSF
ncbi:hypothetical protein H4Q26_013597 [Puccinia striiformis f. sp. tritici PST-130]|nr:hypothetical protein H4Q26_013597 [Puccinia striiformis f. sp. tritici PST-130]